MPKKDNRLILYEKMELLLLYSKNLLNKYPKSERFNLCSDIKEIIYKSLKNIMYAWKSKDSAQRYNLLNEIDVDMYVLKTLTKISYEYKYITPKNYMVWNDKISEIGKMLGGWMKTCQKE